MAIDREQAVHIIEAFISLMRVSRTVMHRDADHSVSGTPVAILRLIRDTDLRLGDLADRLRVKPSVASRAVAALESEGLVERTPDPDDARACRIHLTVAGRTELSTREDHVVGLVTDAFADWSPDQVRQSLQMLSRLERGVLDWVGDHEHGSPRSGSRSSDPAHSQDGVDTGTDPISPDTTHTPGTSTARAPAAPSAAAPAAESDRTRPTSDPLEETLA